MTARPGKGFFYTQGACLSKPRQESHLLRHRTIELMNKTMKLLAQNTIQSFLSPFTARQREMVKFYVLWRTCAHDGGLYAGNFQLCNSLEE